MNKKINIGALLQMLSYIYLRYFRSAILYI